MLSAHPRCAGLVQLSLCNRSYGCATDDTAHVPAAASELLAADLTGDMRTDLIGVFGGDVDAACEAGEGERCSSGGRKACCACGLACVGGTDAVCTRVTAPRLWANLPGGGFRVRRPFENNVSAPADTDADPGPPRRDASSRPRPSPPTRASPPPSPPPDRAAPQEGRSPSDAVIDGIRLAVRHTRPSRPRQPG